MNNQLITVGQALKSLEAKFSTAKIENPKLNAELMLCELLECDRAHMYLQAEVELDSQQIDTLRC